jgi:3-isopropylmalate/(R)-2-methylmalate dehydratase large subunit
MNIPDSQRDNQPRTLLEKIWHAHVVKQEPACPAVLYIDLHLVHEVTSPQAFDGLRRRGLPVRRTDRTFATMDHSTPTETLQPDQMDPQAARQVAQLERNCAEFKVPLYGWGDSKRGIVHVIGPELGVTQPGKTIVCGDSHTATHGAFGALAFGIGTSEVEHVLATQCLLQTQPKSFSVEVTGRLGFGVSAKDLILALIAQIGIGGGTGHVFEYRGEAMRAMSMAERMTVCNMSIEAGARAGMVAPDDVTYHYLAGREFAPSGAAWERALAAWRALPSDEGASFDRSVTLDASRLAPMITYGTNPGMGMPIDGQVPDPLGIVDPRQRQAAQKALAYMGLQPGQQLLGHPVDVVFVGSCTNGRLEDLREVAQLLRGRHVAQNTRVLVVPGSEQVKLDAEAEGLDEVFRAAGAEWRLPGCSMCLGMNGDLVPAGKYAVSTSNRNFEGRQGQGARTLLAGPWVAAAAALSGHVADPRPLLAAKRPTTLDGR